MNVKKTICCLAAAALVLSACDKDDNTTQVSTTDKDFMSQATLSNLAEVDAGQLASTKGTKDSVKMYGSMMVSEHTKANTTLDSLAKKKSVSGLPTAVDAEHAALKTRLSGYTGRTFDTAYVNAQVKDHAKTVTIFQNEISNGQNQDVKNFATKLLPDIQMHLTKAQTLQKGL